MFGAKIVFNLWLTQKRLRINPKIIIFDNFYVVVKSCFLYSKDKWTFLIDLKLGFTILLDGLE